MSISQMLSAYSIWIAFPGFLLGLVMLVPIKRWSVRIPVYTLVIVIGLAVILLLRPGDSTVSSKTEVNDILASGQPVFVEFFSNSCTLCLASEPNVRNLRSAVDGRAEIVRLNVRDEISLPLMRRYGAFSLPTFVVVDGAGEVIWRQSSSLLNVDAALDALGLEAT
jgi:thiol-disulfide isomerase/thioredoxin